MSTQKKSRRSPTPDERGKAADRSRTAILEAALTEFSSRGYAGARTAAIAVRAGVNPQLISYYFGGKEGLYTELLTVWAAHRADEVQPFPASASPWIGRVLDEPEWAKLVIWRALGDTPTANLDGEDFATRFRGEAEHIRTRQDSGEITDRVDPEFLLLLTYALSFAPIALPYHVQGISGRDPQSPDYRAWVSEQLLHLETPARPQL